MRYRIIVICSDSALLGICRSFEELHVFLGNKVIEFHFSLILFGSLEYLLDAVIVCYDMILQKLVL